MANSAVREGINFHSEVNSSTPPNICLNEARQYTHSYGTAITLDALDVSVGKQRFPIKHTYFVFSQHTFRQTLYVFFNKYPRFYLFLEDSISSSTISAIQ